MFQTVPMNGVLDHAYASAHHVTRVIYVSIMKPDEYIYESIFRLCSNKDDNSIPVQCI